MVVLVVCAWLIDQAGLEDRESSASTDTQGAQSVWTVCDTSVLRRKNFRTFTSAVYQSFQDNKLVLAYESILSFGITECMAF